MSVARARTMPPWRTSTFVAVTSWRPAWVTLIVSPVTDRGDSAGSIAVDPPEDSLSAGLASAAFARVPLAVECFGPAVFDAAVLGEVERLPVRAGGEPTWGPEPAAARPASAAASRAAASSAPARPASTDGSGVSCSAISSSGLRDRPARAAERWVASLPPRSENVTEPGLAASPRP